MPCLSNAQSSTLQPTKNADMTLFTLRHRFRKPPFAPPHITTERFENDTYSKGFNFGIILKANFYLKSISKRSCVNEAKICVEYVAAFWMNVWKNCFELS